MPHSSPLLLFTLFLLLLSFSISTAQQLPNPDPQIIHPDEQQQQQQQQQTLHTTPSSSSTTIPSFPEQSAITGCPLSLPNTLFPSVKSACSIDHHTGKINYTPLHHSRCCPVLAAWLYSSYSATALGHHLPHPSIKTTTTTTTTIINTNRSTSISATPNSYEMPMLPDDSEGCVDGLETAMKANGVDLGRPNASCDVVYCYCGIRLHQLSCPTSFRVMKNGELVGDGKVDRLEKDCDDDDDGNTGSVVGCSKCLNSLYKLNRGDSSNGNKSVVEMRTNKMRNKECELMGLTWLLDKNRTAYLNTVTLVLRALMQLNDQDHHHQSSTTHVSCRLGRDGMPLPVASTEISHGTPLSITTTTSAAGLFQLMFVCIVFCMTLGLS